MGARACAQSRAGSRAVRPVASGAPAGEQQPDESGAGWRSRCCLGQPWSRGGGGAASEAHRSRQRRNRHSIPSANPRPPPGFVRISGNGSGSPVPAGRHETANCELWQPPSRDAGGTFLQPDRRPRLVLAGDRVVLGRCAAGFLTSEARGIYRPGTPRLKPASLPWGAGSARPTALPCGESSLSACVPHPTSSQGV